MSTTRSTFTPSSTPLVTRRTALRTATLGATGLAAGLGGTLPAVAAPPPAGVFAVGDEVALAIEATAVWVAPGTARYKPDNFITSSSVDVDLWLDGMRDTEARRWLTGKLETMVNLGARLVVDEIDGKWTRVVVPDQPTSRDPRGYPGWVPTAQLIADRDFLDRLAAGPVATVSVQRSVLARSPDLTRPALPVAFGTTLPVLDVTDQAVTVLAPGGYEAYLPADAVVVREAGEAPPVPRKNELLRTADMFRGLRYLYGGTTGWGVDGSGFVYAVLRHHGIHVARDAADQRDHSGLEEVRRRRIRPGDLVFFTTEPGRDTVGQVAVALGDDRILLSPDAAHGIEERSLRDENPAATYAGARRLPLARRGRG